MAFIIFLVLIIGLAADHICIFIKKIDQALNFSMKKKIKVKRIPLYFPNDRKNESKLGETLENPNEGVYLPAFICCLVTYFSVLLAIVYAILGCTITMPELIDAVLFYGFIVIMGVYAVIFDGLRRHYKYKYYDNQEYWIAEVKKKIAEREKKQTDDANIT